MLRALSIVKLNYSDVHLFAAGSDIFMQQKNTPKWRRASFVNYIFDMIEKLGLQNNITFCGSLNAEKMKEEYLKANVFVCSSLLENSPNSVGEAMILGVPVVSANVGGVSNMLKHGKEGYVYPVDEEYMLAYYIQKIFSDPLLAEKLSKSAMDKANRTHNRSYNCSELYNIYKELVMK